MTHKKQFDVHIIYFDEESKTVCRKYLISQFVGCIEILIVYEYFEKSLGKLDMKNIIQVYTDGSNFNWKVIRNIIGR